MISSISHFTSCHRVTHMLLWITSEQSTTLFTSIYKTSKGDIHIPSQDHFIHLLGVYDVHIVLVEVWVHLVSGVSIERYWLRSWLRCILSVNLNTCHLCNSQWTLTCWLPSSLLFNLDISLLCFWSPYTMKLWCKQYSPLVPIHHHHSGSYNWYG